jgi:aldose 1-epimerase
VYLRYDGKDILRPLTDEAQIAVNPYLQGAPILLPANRTYLGKFSFEGVDYTLPITEPRTNSHLHGTVHRKPFTVLEVGESFVKMKFINEGEVYPFTFALTVTYALDEEGLSQTYEIVNTDSKNMPYTFCLHTTFVEPERFTFPIKSRQENDDIDIPTGRYIPLTEQERSYLSGSPSRGLNVCGYYEASGHTVTADDIAYTVSENFDHWITYNARGEGGFLCLEPQAGKVNGLNISDGHRILAPGKSDVYKTKFTHIN